MSVLRVAFLVVSADILGVTDTGTDFAASGRANPAVFSLRFEYASQILHFRARVATGTELLCVWSVGGLPARDGFEVHVKESGEDGVLETILVVLAPDCTISLGGAPNG